MNKPPTAVIIANFNNSEYILDALKSALVQTYESVGIFITDDCSTDDSLNVVKAFCGEECHVSENEHHVLTTFNQKRFPIHLFALKKNVGRGIVRNFSIEYALNNGYYLVQILDADDILYDTKVEKLANAIIENPELVGLAYADYLIANELGNTHYECKFAYDINLMRQMSIVHSGAMINSLALKKVGLYPNQPVCEDWHLFRRICQSMIAIHLPEPLTIVRAHSMDSTSSVQSKVWEECHRKTLMET